MFQWFKREPPTHVVIIEPSPFRTDETYIIGPFTLSKAQKMGRRELRKHPFGEAFVWSRHRAIMRGATMFRPADPI